MVPAFYTACWLLILKSIIFIAIKTFYMSFSLLPNYGVGFLKIGKMSQTSSHSSKYLVVLQLNI
jgi:hypothetical protein